MPHHFSRHHRSLLILLGWLAIAGVLFPARGGAAEPAPIVFHARGVPIEPSLSPAPLADDSPPSLYSDIISSAVLALNSHVPGGAFAALLVKTGGVSAFGFPGATLAAAQDALEAEFQALVIPVAAVAGETDTRYVHHPDFWKAQYGGLNFAVDLDGVWFIALNSGLPGLGRPGFTREAIAFFEEKISQIPPDAPLVVAFHHALDDPRWASRDDWGRVTSALRNRPAAIILLGPHASKTIEIVDQVGVVFAPPQAELINAVQWRADEGRWRVYRVDETGAPDELDWPRPAGDNAAPGDSGADPAGSGAFIIHSDDALSSPVIRWRTALPGGGVLAAPLVWGDALYAAGTNGILTALDLATGRPLWAFDAGGSILGAPAAAHLLGTSLREALIVFGAGNGRLFALRPDGSMRWIFYAGWPVFGGPAISPDGLAAFFGTSGGEIIALDAANGRPLWINADPGYAVTAVPALDGEHLYATAWDGFLYALDRRTGATLWKRPGPSHFRSPDRTQAPAVSTPVTMPGGDFFVADNGWRAGRYSPAGAWRGYMNSGVAALALSAAGDALYLRRAVSPFCKVTVSGRPIWETRLDTGGAATPPIEHAGTVYVTTDRGAVWAFDAETGRALWEYRPRPALPMAAAPVIARLPAARAKIAGSPERDAPLTPVTDPPPALLILANADGVITAIDLHP